MAEKELLKVQAEVGMKSADEKTVSTPGQGPESKNSSVSETWAEETIADLDDFIESQGIYIRQ